MGMKRIMIFAVIAVVVAGVAFKAAASRSLREYRCRIEREVACVNDDGTLFPDGEPAETARKKMGTVPSRSKRYPGDSPHFLNIRLLGTVVTEPALAYIEDIRSRKKGTYRVGDVVKDARLVEIRSGEVTLERGGELERLVLAKANAVTRLSETEALVSREGVLEEIDWDIDNLTHMAKASFCYDTSSDEFVGVKLNGIPKGSLIECAGMRNGDIIRVVNGQTLSTPQRAIQTMRKARRLPKINIELLRQKRSVSMSYDIEL